MDAVRPDVQVKAAFSRASDAERDFASEKLEHQGDRNWCGEVVDWYQMHCNGCGRSWKVRELYFHHFLHIFSSFTLDLGWYWYMLHDGLFSWVRFLFPSHVQVRLPKIARGTLRTYFMGSRYLFIWANYLYTIFICTIESTSELKWSELEHM